MGLRCSALVGTKNVRGWLAAAVLALSAPACGFSPPGEFTVAQCSDMIDNDQNGETDCEDKRCRALSICGGRPEPKVVLTPLDPPAGEADAGPRDASRPVGPPANDDPDDDAGKPDVRPPADPCEDVACGEAEVCSNGVCLPEDAPRPTVYKVRVRLNSLVLGTARNADLECLDPDTECVLRGCFGLACDGCKCTPDPYVAIHVDGVEVARTPAVPNQLIINPWDTGYLEFSFTEDQTAEIIVFDSDGEDEEGQLIFARTLPKPPVRSPSFADENVGRLGTGVSTLDFHLELLE